MQNYLSWGKPDALHMLWGAVVLLLLAWWAVSRRTVCLREFLGARYVAGEWVWHWRRHWLKGVLFSVAAALVVIAGARPRVGTEMQKVKREGADVVLVLDTSDSMLAQDVKPSRLEAAKEAAQSLVARLQGGDRIGIVVFAGSAYMYSPLTIDHDAASMFIDSIERGSAPAPGTALGGAMTSALHLLEGAEHPHKSIVLFSDGEDHPGMQFEGVDGARAQGVQVHVVGLGGTEGEPIPVPAEDNAQGKDAQGLMDQFFGSPQPTAAKSKYKHDTKGNVVLTRLDEKMLTEVARRGGGVFVKSSSSGANVDRIAQAIGSMEGAVVGTYEYTGYAERFQWPLGVALALLLLEGLIAAAPRAKRKRGDGSG